jgi:hypothetical protein
LAATDERLLRALAEQLKLPLVQIARTAELAADARDPAVLATISYIADTALGLLDSFLLTTDLESQESLELEPVSVSSVLNDTAHRLQPLARQHNCDIEISLSGKYGPVMAHQESLESALTLLGYSLIEARGEEGQRHEILLAAHRSARGLVTGVFDNQPGLSTDIFRRGRALYGEARQAMPMATGTNGAGVFVADALMKAMSAPLHVARHHKRAGLAVTLHPSSQLQIV